MLIHNKRGLILLLTIVFMANLGETWLETLQHKTSPISIADYKGAYAVQRFEPELVNFIYHEASPEWAVYGYSISYFVLLPVICLGVAVALARRRARAPFRIFSLAVTTAYLVSLPWFLLFPVPERWMYPESNAMLLSDRWSSRLIESIRPLSAMNNSFPSFYVSLTVIIVLVCWLFHIRLRNTVTLLGLSVILSTFTLGINWLASIIAGVLVGLISVAAAWRL
jgi:hypothetical protein